MASESEIGLVSDEIKAQSPSYAAGIMLELNDPMISSVKEFVSKCEAETKAEVALIYNGVKREITYEELIRFFKGE
jgi:hypothetical protein